MSEPCEHQSCSACNSWWRLPLLLAIVLAAIVLMLRRAPEPVRRSPQISPENVAADPNAQSVRLAINFGDDREPMSLESHWHKGMTVADLLNSQPRISVASTGSGTSTFLTSLNGVTKEGAGGRNWTYRVNDKHADRSFAVYELQPNDQVLWTFATPQ